MSENRWLRRTDPLKLLEMLYPSRTLGSTQPQSRRSSLYLSACARKQWERLPLVGRVLLGLAETYADAAREEKGSFAAVTLVAERLFNSAGDPDDLRSAQNELMTLEHLAPVVARAWRSAHALAGTAAPVSSVTSEEWRGVAALLYLPFEPMTPTYMWVPRELHDIELLRDVYGNPFRHVPFSPEWRTDTAVSLARQIYNAREFGTMRILADALQDAGCDSDDILNHCRDTERIHTRGCWVLDLVLEKK